LPYLNSEKALDRKLGNDVIGSGEGENDWTTENLYEHGIDPNIHKRAYLKALFELRMSRLSKINELDVNVSSLSSSNLTCFSSLFCECFPADGGCEPRKLMFDARLLVFIIGFPQWGQFPWCEVDLACTHHFS
jgi:hypothetical protein